MQRVPVGLNMADALARLGSDGADDELIGYLRKIETGALEGSSDGWSLEED